MALCVSVSGQGPDLVLVHGWGMNAAVWAPLLPYLEGRWRVHRVDLPGHGRSPWSGEHTLVDWAGAVTAAVPAGALWVGWSLGGLVTLQAARDGHLRAWLAVAANPRFLRAADWPCALDPAVLEQFGRELLDDPQGTLRRFLALQVQGAEDARATLKHLRQALQERGMAAPEALAVGLSLLRESDLRPHLAALDAPGAWLLGGRDRIVPPCLGEHLARLVPRQPVTCLAGAGHAPFLTHPEAIATALEVLS